MGIMGSLFGVAIGNFEKFQNTTLVKLQCFRTLGLGLGRKVPDDLLTAMVRRSGLLLRN